MNTDTPHLVQHSPEREQFLDSYAENLTVAMDILDVLASELAQAGDYQASSFFTGIGRAIGAFGANHYPMTRMITGADLG